VKNYAAMLASAAMLAGSLPAQAVTQDEFLVRRTRDVIALCSAAETDPLYTAAIHFCHGFLLGAFQYHVAAREGLGTKKVCLPTPQPSRNEGIRNFIDWARDNPQFWDENPVDTMVRFVDLKWECRS